MIELATKGTCSEPLWLSEVKYFLLGHKASQYTRSEESGRHMFSSPAVAPLSWYRVVSLKNAQEEIHQIWISQFPTHRHPHAGGLYGPLGQGKLDVEINRQ